MTKLPRGVGAALLAALLFGVSTPLAKLLPAGVSPVLLAGLLYLGSGIGLTALRSIRRVRGAEAAPLTKAHAPWLAGAVLFGGVAGPVLLMLGLRATPASTTALLLNLEGVFTALLAWFVFHENFDRGIALGMGLIVAGGAALSWQRGEGPALPAGALAVAAACPCWAIDNNLTQKVSAVDPLLVASIKGLVAVWRMRRSVSCCIRICLPPGRAVWRCSSGSSATASASPCSSSRCAISGRPGPALTSRSLRSSEPPCPYRCCGNRSRRRCSSRGP